MTTNREIPFAETTYRDHTGPEHRAILVTWNDIEAFLGHPHDGSAEDDAALVAALVAAGAPSWVPGDEGWTEEAGWGLIGPEVPDAI